MQFRLRGGGDGSGRPEFGAGLRRGPASVGHGVLLDEAVGLDVDLAGAIGELSEQFFADTGDLQCLVAVGAAVTPVPLHSESLGQDVGEDGVVVLGDRDDAAVDRDTVEAAPFLVVYGADLVGHDDVGRSDEHTSELQSLMPIPYAVFCMKTK